MSENLESKKQLVSELKEQLASAKSMIFVDYRGITVSEDTELRRNFRNENVTYKVFKNRLLMRALDEMGITGYDAKNFEGTTAVAFAEDETAPARILSKFAKECPALEIKAGVVEGITYDAQGMATIANIPSREELLSKFLGSIQSPITNFARVLNQIAEKGGADACEAAAPAVEEAAAE